MRSRALRTAAFVGAAVAVISGGTATFCTVSRTRNALVRAYLEAEPVTPIWNVEVHPAEPMWNRQIDVGHLAVTVSARCCVGGNFVAQYSDEPGPRVMFTPGDYVLRLRPRRSPPPRIIGRCPASSAARAGAARLATGSLGERTLQAKRSASPPAPTARMIGCSLGGEPWTGVRC